MKKTWDNLKVGDKFYKFDLWKNMFDEYSVIDIGLKGYIAFHFVSNPPDIINVMHIDKVKEECSLTNTKDEELLAKGKYSLHRIKELQELFKYYKETTESIKKEISNLKKEIKK